MKVYIATSIKYEYDKRAIDDLCRSVRNAKLVDVCIARNNHHGLSQKDLWNAKYDELYACDALLVDISDSSNSTRMVEIGMAFALRKAVIIVKKKGVAHKNVFNGIASTIVEYSDYTDLSNQLRKYDDGRNFNVTDKSTLLVMFLLVGGIISWVLAQVFIPLALPWMLMYWAVVRKYFSPMRVFDRVVVYIPLAFVWWYGFYLIGSGNISVTLAWTIAYWAVALFVLSRLKFSL